MLLSKETKPNDTKIDTCLLHKTIEIKIESPFKGVTNM